MAPPAAYYNVDHLVQERQQRAQHGPAEALKSPAAPPVTYDEVFQRERRGSAFEVANPATGAIAAAQLSGGDSPRTMSRHGLAEPRLRSPKRNKSILIPAQKVKASDLHMPGAPKPLSQAELGAGAGEETKIGVPGPVPPRPPPGETLPRGESLFLEDERRRGLEPPPPAGARKQDSQGEERDGAYSLDTAAMGDSFRDAAAAAEEDALSL